MTSLDILCWHWCSPWTITQWFLVPGVCTVDSQHAGLALWWRQSAKLSVLGVNAVLAAVWFIRGKVSLLLALTRMCRPPCCQSVRSICKERQDSCVVCVCQYCSSLARASWLHCVLRLKMEVEEMPDKKLGFCQVSALCHVDVLDCDVRMSVELCLPPCFCSHSLLLQLLQ